MCCYGKYYAKLYIPYPSNVTYYNYGFQDACVDECTSSMFTIIWITACVLVSLTILVCICVYLTRLKRHNQR